MKLITCLEIADECGFKTVEEAIRNVQIHAMNIFSYNCIQQEINELLKETKELFDTTGFIDRGSCKEVLDYLKGGSE